MVGKVWYDYGMDTIDNRRIEYMALDELITAKEAFHLADSIMRYECCRYDGEDYLPDGFDSSRDVIAEMQTIPDAMVGAAYKWFLKAETIDWYKFSHRNDPNRIMKIYNEKLRDRDFLARGSHIQYPNGYGTVAGRMVVKRIPIDKIRMT